MMLPQTIMRIMEQLKAVEKTNIRRKITPLMCQTMKIQIAAIRQVKVQLQIAQKQK